MRFSLVINYWRWAFVILLMAAFFILFPTADEFLLALGLLVAYFLAGPLYRRVKKTFFKPIMLFDLHGVIIAGDFQVEDIYELPGTRDLMRRLRKRYFTAALTNFSPELINFYNRKFGLMGEFDAFYYSGQYGIRKPDERVFHLVLRDLGVRASDVIFFDDVEANVQAAGKLGLKTILFRSASQAEKELNTMGIRIR